MTSTAKVVLPSNLDFFDMCLNSDLRLGDLILRQVSWAAARKGRRTCSELLGDSLRSNVDSSQKSHGLFTAIFSDRMGYRAYHQHCHTKGNS